MMNIQHEHKHKSTSIILWLYLISVAVILLDHKEMGVYQHVKDQVWPYLEVLGHSGVCIAILIALSLIL